MRVPPKIAINPLPWVLQGFNFDLSEETLRAALTDLQSVGFSALHSDVPPSMTAQQYLAMLSKYGFAPAPGYFAAEFHRPDKLESILEGVKAHAGMIAALGVDATFVAGSLEIPRVMNPGWGENGSAQRTQRSADALALAADAALGEGVRLALHPHLGMSIETEEETRAILDATAGSALGFGPDTGHLFTAGMLPQQIIADYADRVVAVHLKDVDLNTLRTSTHYSDDFLTTTNVRHLWREPGRGAVNFPAVLDALGDFDGWFVIEVDVPSLPDRVESARASLDYLLTLPSFQQVNA